VTKRLAQSIPKRTAKAELISEKDRAIVLAARENFVRDGFAGASMDAIAKSAGVSVKTIYGHFANKDELFSNVMIGACSDNLFAGGTPSVETLQRQFAWFSKATKKGLFEAGKEYLGHLLSKDELALYRAVTRDAGRFPELGRQYQRTIARGRTGILIAYLRSLFREKNWNRRDAVQDASSYEGLLRASIFEEALHGLSTVSSDAINEHAAFASKTMWILLADECGT
jgi:AcrR family transcriptional regulator